MVLTAEVVGARVETVPEAVARMTQICGALPVDDGIARFNNLYLLVTSEVQRQLEKGDFFQDNVFLERLDVEFANRYFDALRAWTAQPDDGGADDVPNPWRVLFRQSQRDGITAIQFAAAGVNAHINYDLPLALAATWDDRRVGRPRRGGTHRTDYNRVTDIFDQLYDDFRDALLPSIIERYDEAAVASALDRASHFVVDKARDAAWWGGKGIDSVRRSQKSVSRMVNSIESLTSLSGHLLLQPVL